MLDNTEGITGDMQVDDVGSIQSLFAKGVEDDNDELLPGSSENEGEDKDKDEGKVNNKVDEVEVDVTWLPDLEVLQQRVCELWVDLWHTIQYFDAFSRQVEKVLEKGGYFTRK